MKRNSNEYYEPMTKEDCVLYKFLIDFFKENGYAPSICEIAQGIYCAPSNVMPKLCRLQSLEKITIKQGVSRAIKLVEYELVQKQK